MDTAELTAHEAIAAIERLSRQGGFLHPPAGSGFADQGHPSPSQASGGAEAGPTPSSMPHMQGIGATDAEVVERRCHTHLDLALLLRDIWWTESQNAGVERVRLLPVRQEGATRMGWSYEARRDGHNERRPHTSPCPGTGSLVDMEILLERALIALRLAHGTQDDRHDRTHPTGLSFYGRFLLEKPGHPAVLIRWSWRRRWSNATDTSFGEAIAKIVHHPRYRRLRAIDHPA